MTAPLPLRIVVHGAAGRMGRVLVQRIEAAADLLLVGAVDHAEHPDQGGTLQHSQIPLTADLDAVLPGADMMIDFSLAPAVPSVVSAACRHGTALVCGTTGLDAPALGLLRDAAAHIPVVQSPNMSLGVNLLLRLTQLTAGALNDGWDSEIVELHHRHKRDAPSGTALALAQAIARGRELDLDDVLVTERGRELPVRSADEIGVLAVRGGDVAGEHTVFFFGEQERIELTHRATDRAIFVRGALVAARWLAGRGNGLYDMQDVLFGPTPEAP